MSFRCRKCLVVQPDGTPQRMVILERRNKTYPVRLADDGTVIDPGGQGWEIVKAVPMCPACAKEQ